MKVTVKLFAALRQQVGSGELSKEIEEGSTVEQLWDFLREESPQLPDMKESLLYAVNRSYVTRDHVLQDQDEVVFVPPVSGG
jgi:molybdopterin synthase sulfur carrier subunit